MWTWIFGIGLALAIILIVILARAVIAWAEGCDRWRDTAHEWRAKHALGEERLLYMLAVYCRGDFVRRKLCLRVEVQHDPEKDSWQIDCQAAPHDIHGETWRFAVSCDRPEPIVEEFYVYISASPDGWDQSVRMRVAPGDAWYDAAARLLDLARCPVPGRGEAGVAGASFRHEEALPYIEAFMGREELPDWTSCITFKTYDHPLPPAARVPNDGTDDTD